MIYFAIFVAVMSILSFALYGIDKAKAKAHKWRIKEAVLLGFGFFGGAIGALFGMVLFHHKTKHWYFWIVNFLGIGVVVAVFVLLFINGI